MPNTYPRDISRKTYIDDLTGTEAGASVVPVIFAQLIDLDSFLVAGARHLHGHTAAEEVCASPSANKSLADAIRDEKEMATRTRLIWSTVSLSVGLVRNREVQNNLRSRCTER